MTLSPAHLEHLASGSGLDDDSIDLRGYYTATDKAELPNFPKSQQLVPSLAIPIYTVDGHVAFTQIRPDSPRIVKGKSIKYETPAGTRMAIDVPPRSRKAILDPSIPLWITEGVKKGDALAQHGLCAIDLIGVWNHRGTNEYGGLTDLSDWSNIALNGRTIYIAFDNDVMLKPEVKKAMIALARMLKRRGAGKIIPIVPHIESHEGKLGVDDFFVLGGTAAELIACANLELLDIDKPEIRTNARPGGDIHDDAIKALVKANDPPTVFVRGGELVSISADERDILKIEALGVGGVRNKLTNAARWVSVRTKDKETETTTLPYCPKDVVEHFLAERTWPNIPPIVAITRAPVLAPSLHLSMEPGYCQESRFYVATHEPWPTWSGSAEDAVCYIFEDFLVDFPFKTDADRAHALALLILPIVRPAIDGQTPLHLIDAPSPGSGKSLLARVCLMVTSGDHIAGTPGSKDEEEWRKKITAAIYEGQPYIFFDNLTQKVESAALDAALTQPEWTDRMLQQTRTVKAPIKQVWVATANNAELSTDVTRRTIWCRLDAGVERPEDRKGFVHESIEAWVRENRPNIISALCKIVQNWLDADYTYTGRLHGSYEEWSKVIGGILGAANVPGFLGNVDELRSKTDTDRAAWASFMFRWFKEFGSEATKAGDLRELFEKDSDLAGQLGNGQEAARTTRLAFLLRKRVDGIFGGIKIERSIATYGSSYCYKAIPQKGFMGLETDANPQNPQQTLNGNLGSTFEGFEGFEGLADLSSRAGDAGAGAPAQGNVSENPPNPQKPSNPQNELDEDEI